MSATVMSNLRLPHELRNLKMRESMNTATTDNMQSEAEETTTSSYHDNESHKVNTTELYGIPLQHINPSFGIVNVSEKSTKLQPAVIQERRNANANVTIVFAVRTVGCGGCREHAVQLADLAKADKKLNVVAAVKETGVDDEALLEFYQDYWHHPIYKDSKWKIFHAMGGRKLSLFTVLKHSRALFKRIKTKGIASKVRQGDFWTKGGVMIFNRKGDLKYTQYEHFGKEWDMDAIQEAIHDIRVEQREEHRLRKSNTTASSDLN